MQCLNEYGIIWLLLTRLLFDCCWLFYSINQSKLQIKSILHIFNYSYVCKLQKWSSQIMRNKYTQLSASLFALTILCPEEIWVCLSTIKTLRSTIDHMILFANLLLTTQTNYITKYLTWNKVRSCSNRNLNQNTFGLSL